MRERVIEMQQEDEDEEAGITGNELIELYGADAVELAFHYLHRYRVYKMFRAKIELNYTDIHIFFIISEEVQRKQALDMKRWEDKTKG